MPSILIQTLGCKLNQLESEAITGAFRQVGFRQFNSSDASSPSVVVINTCTVTSKADQKARRVIRKALRDYPDACVLVTGCYAQLNGGDIQNIDNGGRLFVLGGQGKENILSAPSFFDKNADFRAALKTWEQANALQNTAGVFQFNPERFSSRTRSFLKIQDGCDKHCTYCRVRLARGKSVSLNPAEVLLRLRMLEENHAEAVLTGVNISQYRGGTGAANLGELLEYLLAGTVKISLRLSSLAPESIDENLAKILSHKRIRPHFHLSIQSGSKKILEKMGRAYDAQIIEKAVSLLRRAKDDPFLACDIITGFPGETKAEFEETFELCKKIDFAWIHVFPYSKRPGTPAWSFAGAVHEGEVSKRVEILTVLARQGRAAYTRRWLGCEVEVLVEKGKSLSSHCRAVSENYLKLLVRYNGEPPLPGAVLRCKLIEEPHPEADYDSVAISLS
jgi:threonylcarbamoyladenosine tRNA methylthiotransferase MtaB